MTASPQAATTWHHEVVINGQPYPTRHDAPDIQGMSEACLNLPPRQLDHCGAIHEAGHAIATLVGGGHLHSAQITPGGATSPLGEGGVTKGCHLSDGQAFAVFCGIGERASDRWLRQAGLWTPARAVATEVGAYSDRQALLDLNPHLGFGDTEADYRVVHDLADAVIDQHWDAIQTVADALADQHYLTGDTIAALAELPNASIQH